MRRGFRLSSIYPHGESDGETSHHTKFHAKNFGHHLKKNEPEGNFSITSILEKKFFVDIFNSISSFLFS